MFSTSTVARTNQFLIGGVSQVVKKLQNALNESQAKYAKNKNSSGENHSYVQGMEFTTVEVKDGREKRGITINTML